MTKIGLGLTLLLFSFNGFALRPRATTMVGIPNQMSLTETYASLAAGPTTMSLTKLDLSKVGKIDNCGNSCTINLTLNEDHPAMSLTAGSFSYPLTSISAEVRSSSGPNLLLTDIISLSYAFTVGDTSLLVTVNYDGAVHVQKIIAGYWQGWASGSVTLNY